MLNCIFVPSACSVSFVTVPVFEIRVVSLAQAENLCLVLGGPEAYTWPAIQHQFVPCLGKA